MLAGHEVETKALIGAIAARPFLWGLSNET